MSSCWFTIDVEPDVHLACFRLAGTFAAEDVEAQARTWLLAHDAPPLAFPVVETAKAREAG